MKALFVGLTLGVMLTSLPGAASGNSTGCFFEQPSYTGNCLERPEGTVCLGFDDGYLWLVSDAIHGWGVESCGGSTVRVAYGYEGTYRHILGTNLVNPASSSPHVMVNGCDSAVVDTLLDSCCTMTDLIKECANNAQQHGQFVQAVAHLTNRLKANGQLSTEGKTAIQECAAGSRLP